MSVTPPSEAWGETQPLWRVSLPVPSRIPELSIESNYERPSHAVFQLRAWLPVTRSVAAFSSSTRASRNPSFRLLLTRLLKEFDPLLEPPDIIAGYVASDLEFSSHIAGNG